MRLALQGVAKRVAGEAHLHPIDLALAPGALTVLLGATLAGKTSLLRLMAGLDRPTSGRVLVDDRDVTGVPVRRRDVAMVYQQFINYPSLTVRDNIASPMRLKGRADADTRAREVARRLRIDHLLDRLPAQLSGGQQQRVALARALAKEAPLTLLDEPLVNLDYKLREGLRDELVELFSTGRSTVVYATTEPGEALLLGGRTAVLDAGELLQHGPTADVFNRPASIRVARAFSDPPMNLLPARAADGRVRLPGDVSLAVPDAAGAHGPVTLGLRAAHLRPGAPRGDEVALPAEVTLAEISGSETYLHVDTPVGALVAQLTGVHRHALGERLALRVDPRDAYLFDADGALLAAPARRAPAPAPLPSA